MGQNLALTVLHVPRDSRAHRADGDVVRPNGEDPLKSLKNVFSKAKAEIWP